MARPSSATVSEVKPRDQDLRGYEAELSTDGLLEALDLTPGMISAIPRAKRPIGSSPSIINGRVREDWVGRRGGYPNYITKPDSSDIMRMVSFHGEQNANRVVRVANGAMHVASTTAAWVSMTGTPYSIFQRTDHAQLLGNLYLANPELKILQLDFQDISYAPILNRDLSKSSEAPVCRYITAFGDRLIAAYIHSPTDGVLPFGLQWSINADPRDWTGVGSGSENLIQSPSDTGDEITGIFGFSSIAVIFRERSIWHISRQPFSIAPFRFDAVITNQGCDMPWSIARVSDEQGRTTGFIYGDKRTNGIFSYTPGSRPVRLPASTNIEDVLFTGLTDPARCVGAYDPKFQEYHYGYPTASQPSTDLANFRVFSLKNNSVVTDDGPACTSIDVVTDIGAPVMIDDLVSSIDSQVGTIEDLGGVFIFETIVVKGDTAGQSIKEDLGTTGSHTFTWTSQDLGSISRRRTLKMMTMAMSASSSGNVILQWSKDNSTWTTIKTIADASALVKIGFKKQVTGDIIYWRVTALAADFKMTDWWVKIMERGLKKLS
jgi:hypothetical protein